MGLDQPNDVGMVLSKMEEMTIKLSHGVQRSKKRAVPEEAASSWYQTGSASGAMRGSPMTANHVS